MSEPSKENKNNGNNISTAPKDSNKHTDQPAKLQLPVPEVNIEDVDEDLKEDNPNLEGETTAEDGDERYRKFTAESYRFLVERDLEAKRKADDKKNKVEEGRLVDGELKLGDDEDQDDGEKKEKDPLLIEGNNLPESYLPFPKKFYGVPIEEIDPYITDKSFVVIAKKFTKQTIFRFTPTKSLLLLSPNNALRRAALYIISNQFFDLFIILTILVNCIILALPQAAWMNTAEYVFLAIYSLEMIVKITARGFFIHPYTYLRDGWNWLDFIVVITSYLTLIIEQTSGNSSVVGNIQGVRTFRVLRALKTISVIPGLKTIIQALLKAMKVLAEVMVLMFFCMMVFSMFALQVYAGILRNKCVTDIPDGTVQNDYAYSLWIKNSSNWYRDSEDADYRICGNVTGSGICPNNFTCLTDIGPNPRYGYSNFDNFGWAMLNSFQLITLDFWEDPYNKVIRANGPWNIIFFIMVVFFGSYYLINLMIAVVSMSYEEEAITAGKEKEEERKEKKKKSRQQAENSNYKTKDAKNDKKSSTKTDTSLTGAVNGDSSNTSKVGNGVVRNSDTSKMNGLNRKQNEAKDPSKNSVPSKQHPGSTKLKSDSLVSWDKGTEGYDNPLIRMSQDEDFSIESDSTNGDPPRIIIRGAYESTIFIHWMRMMMKS